MTVTCQVQPNEPTPRKGKLPEKYSDELLKALDNVREANVNAPEIRLAEMAATEQGALRVKRLIEENYFLGALAKRVTLRPGSGNRMSQWIARHFPTLLSKNSDASRVRDFLEEVGSGGKRLIDTLSLTSDSASGMTARLLVAPLMENGYKNVQAAIKKGGASLPKDVLDRMWVDAVELARTPVMYRKVSEGVLSPGAYRAMSAKYDRFLKRLSSYGLGQETLTTLLREAEDINKAFEDLHAISDLAGLDVGDVTNQGISFMPRQFTSDFQFRLRRMDDEVERAFRQSPGAGFTAAFNKSRQTYDLAVEDEFILASVLGLVDDKRISELTKKVDTVTDELLRQDLLDELAELRFDATEKLAPLLDEDGLLVRELAKLPDGVTERLLDSGVLSKVPMTTSEVADFLLSKYDLPYAGIDDLLIVDPKAAYSRAKQQLERQLEKSFTLQGMYKEAINDGWAVTPEVARASEEYSSFVPLSPDVLQRVGIDSPTPLHFHPLAAETLHTMFEVGTDPAHLGTLASVWQYVWKISKEQVLTTPGFLGRQVMQLFISSAMAGTNMAHVIPSIGDWVKFGKQGLDAFDQTRKFSIGGTEYTFRDVISEALKRGVLDTDTGVGVDVALGKAGNQALNPAKFAQAMQNWGSVATGKGALPRVVGGNVRWDAVEYGAGLVGRISEEAAGKVMGSGIWLEQAYKVAFLKTKIDQSLGNALGQFIVGRRPRSYQSLDDLFDEMGDYFLDYTRRGKGDQLLSRNVAPFWMYMSRSMPAVYRHVLRNPSQFVLYNRLYALANEEVRQRGDDAPSGGFAPWQQGPFGHVYVPHPNDDGTNTKYVHIPFASVDPVADVLNRTDDAASSVLRILGFHTGNNKEQIEAIDPTQSKNVLRDVFGQFAAGKAIFGLFTQTDDRGRSLKLRDDEQWATMLGIPVPGGKYSPLTRYMIETTLPAVANIDRWNPFEAFGVKERKDAAGNVVREEKLSVFGFQRDGNDSDVDDLRGQFGRGLLDPINVVRAAGVTVNSVDTAVGMGFTVRDMNRAAKEHKKNFTRLSKALEGGELKGRQAKKAYEAMITSAALYLEIETGKWEAGQWLNARDYLTPDQQKRAANEALRKLKADAKSFNKENAARRVAGQQDVPEDVDPTTLTEADLPSAPPSRPSQVPPEQRGKVLAKP
jgi:hypothetical protein